MRGSGGGLGSGEGLAFRYGGRVQVRGLHSVVGAGFR